MSQPFSTERDQLQIGYYVDNLMSVEVATFIATYMVNKKIRMNELGKSIMIPRFKRKICIGYELKATS